MQTVTKLPATEGLTPSLAQALDDALRARELVKVQLNKSADVTAKEAAETLAKRVRAEVIQTIGRTATLYRHNPDIKRKAAFKRWEAWAKEHPTELKTELPKR